MTDTPERALHEAESWLSSAKHRLMEAENDDADAAVCCSLAIHSIIRANDALSLKFLGYKATRHDDAAAIFAKLSREGKLPATSGDFKGAVADAMRDKSGADYGKSSFSYENAKDYVERAGNFISMARDALNL